MTITLRATKGAALTQGELDGNFTDLNTTKALLAGSASQPFSAATLSLNSAVLAPQGSTSKSRQTIAKAAQTAIGEASYLHMGGAEAGVGALQLLSFGYNAAALTNFPAFVGYVNTDNGGNTNGALVFGTRDVTTDTAPIERLRITAGGNVLVTSGVGLGYGEGAGGTVTQATDKVTAVTLNKPSGRITMNSAALAAGAVVIFQVNNSLCKAVDTVIANIQNTIATLDSYSLRVVAVSSGYFSLVLKNETGASLSNAVEISFSIVKAQTV